MKIAFAFVALLVSISLSAQNTIYSIKYEGLKRTKTDYLDNFLSIKIGDEIDSIAIQNDAQALNNLSILLTCSAKISPTGDVVFVCEEFFPISPTFSFGKIKELFQVRAGIGDWNIFGRAIECVGFYQYYQGHSFGLRFVQPFIKGTKWGFGLNFQNLVTLEPINIQDTRIDYIFRNQRYEVTGRYQFQIDNTIEFGGGYFSEMWRESRETTEENIYGPYKHFKEKINLRARYRLSKMKFGPAQQEGMLTDLYVDGFYRLNERSTNKKHSNPDPLLNQDKIFLQFYNDFLLFKRLGARHNFGSRIRVGASTNNAYPFSPFALDSFLNIRGVGNRVKRGTGMLVFNTDYRFLFAENRWGAGQLVAFMDIGQWRLPNYSWQNFFMPENRHAYYGVGIRLSYKPILNAIFRIDYAINVDDFNNRSFVFGVGQYF